MIKTIGLNEAVAALQRAFGGAYVKAQVVTRATHGELKYGGGKFTKPDAPRDELRNLLVFRTQAKAGRNPVHFPASIEARGRKIWSEGIKHYMRGAGHLRGVANRVAALMLAQILENMDNQRSKGGASFAPLVDYYEKIKRSNYGPTRILEKTGQLRKSLQVAVAVGGKDGRLFRR